MKDNQSDVAMKADIEEQAYAEPKYKPALKFHFNYELKSSWMDGVGVDDLEEKTDALQAKLSNILENLDIKTKTRFIEQFFTQCTQEEIELVAIQGLLVGLD